MKYKDIDVSPLLSIALNAGKEIMKIYHEGFTVEKKADYSPVTDADKKANKIILDGLSVIHPDIPYISEETKQTPFDERKDWDRFWLIDPIDGTKEFIKKNGEFTVNIALVEDGVPVIGIVYAPAKEVLYYGIKGVGSFKRDTSNDQGEIKLHSTGHYSSKKEVVIVASRSHLTPETMDFVNLLKKQGKEVRFISSGSSLKICLVAEGVADVYPRYGPTMEWDTAAAHAVAINADREILNTTTNQPLTYNKMSLKNPFFMVE